MQALLSINGIAPAVQPLTDGFSAERSDLLSDSSGRSAETGAAIRSLVRQGVFKLSLKFKGTSAEIAQVNGLVSAFTQRVSFVYLGETYTIDMYPGNRSVIENGMTAELTVSLVQI